MPCFDLGLEVISVDQVVPGMVNPTDQDYQLDAPQGKTIVSGGYEILSPSPGGAVPELRASWPEVDLKAWNFRIRGTANEFHDDTVKLYIVCVDE